MLDPEERLQRKMKKIAEGNSTSLINNLKLNLTDYLNKSLVFNLKKKQNKPGSDHRKTY